MIWERLETIVSIDSPWVRLVAERWRDDAGRLLDYWRAERPHSVIVPALLGDRLLIPKPMFRPGVGRPTLDLAGGRLPTGLTPVEAAPGILRRELGIQPAMIQALRPLNQDGWLVNSSFESQSLYGVVAELDPALNVDPALLDRSVPFERAGLLALLHDLECLQCRTIVLELLLELR